MVEEEGGIDKEEKLISLFIIVIYIFILLDQPHAINNAKPKQQELLCFGYSSTSRIQCIVARVVVASFL